MITFKIVDGDIVLGGSGRPVMVGGKDKLYQTVKEILLTEVDDRGFGASLGKTGFSVETEITEAMERFRYLQSRSKYSRDKEEKLKAIRRIKVVQEKTTCLFELDLLSEVGEILLVQGETYGQRILD